MSINILGIITAVISFCSLLGVLMGFIIKVATREGKLEERVAQLQQDRKDQDKKSHEKFTELYAFKYETGKDLAEIKEQNRNILQAISEIKDKISEK